MALPGIAWLLAMGVVAGASGAPLTGPSTINPIRDKPRLLILTDIGGDPDDQQSMIHLMTHCNDFEIEGLIATSCLGSHERGTHPELITQIINAYAKARDNLLVHAPGYPSAQSLRAVVRAGTSSPGVAGIGSGHSTAASRWIVTVIEAPDPRPVHISIWGGSTDLAQALYDLAHDPKRNRAETDALLAKLRIYAINDQDGVGAWINRHFPGLWYVDACNARNPSTGKPIKYSAPYRGIYQDETQTMDGTGRQLVPNDQLGLTNLAWATTHIVHNHGPLGALYPTDVWRGPAGKRFPLNDGGGVKEGDAPSWLYLVPNGLNVPQKPAFGGWGGRYAPQPGSTLFLPALDRHWSGQEDACLEQTWTVARWRRAIQNDFAARMDWAVTPDYDKANHPPRSPLKPYEYRSISATAGATVTLSGAGWTDPDGDALSYRWFFYDGPGSYHGPVQIHNANAPEATFTAPAVTAAQTMHFILEVTDHGTPALTDYQRVVVTVTP